MTSSLYSSWFAVLDPAEDSLELLDTDQTDEIVRLDALLRVVVLHRFLALMLLLYVDLVTQPTREGLQTRQAPAVE